VATWDEGSHVANITCCLACGQYNVAFQGATAPGGGGGGGGAVWSGPSRCHPPSPPGLTSRASDAACCWDSSLSRELLPSCSRTQVVYRVTMLDACTCCCKLHQLGNDPAWSHVSQIAPSDTFLTHCHAVVHRLVQTARQPVSLPPSGSPPPWNPGEVWVRPHAPPCCASQGCWGSAALSSQGATTWQHERLQGTPYRRNVCHIIQLSGT
jgi:hypothetical protein